jgi:hypothetical protein
VFLEVKFPRFTIAALDGGRFVRVTRRPPLPATHFCQKSSRSHKYSGVRRPHAPFVFTRYSRQSAACADRGRDSHVFPVPQPRYPMYLQRHEPGTSQKQVYGANSQGSSKLSFPDFARAARNGGRVISLTHRPPLPATHFC